MCKEAKTHECGYANRRKSKKAEVENTKCKNAKVQKCKRVAACIAARSAAPVATCLYLTGVVGTKDLIN